MEESIGSVTKQLLNKYGIRLKKSLGQNYLIDKSALQRIIKAADIQKNDIIIEIGMGSGLLTKEMACIASKIYSFEIDKKIIPAAREYLAGCDNIEIIEGDFLKLPSPNIRGEVKIVANVPYYITTPILERIFEFYTEVKLILN